MNKLLSLLKLDKSSITFIFAISIIVIISVYILTYLNIKDLLKTDYDVINSQTYIESMEKLYSLILDAEAGRRGYLLTGDESLLKPYNAALNKVDSIYKILRVQTLNNPEEQFYLDTLSMLVRERFDVFKRSLEIPGKKSSSLKYQKPFMDEGLELQYRIRSLIERLEKKERLIQLENAELKSSGARFTQTMTAGGIILSIAILVFIFITLKKFNTDIFDPGKTDKLRQDELELLVRERTVEISELINKLYKEVDKLRKTENALELSEHDYKTLFEQAHDAIVIFAPEDEKILNVNERACEIYNIPKNEFIGLSMTVLSKNIPDGKKHIEYTMKDKFLYNFQSVHYKKDGTEMLMEINASVIDFKGIKAILSINRDITDRILSYVPVPGS